VLIVDGTIPGYAYFPHDGPTELLLHPRDAATGISYSLLPMIHAIIDDLLTPEQAAAHVGCIKEHLLGVDGARLFDRPFQYHGGPQRYFQRAESSSFFGREIGIMYMHAHLRYAEAMARYGDADAFLLALRQANPVAVDLWSPRRDRGKRIVTTRARMPASWTVTRPWPSTRQSKTVRFP
jgi:1,2-beta-oligoglucan phosphorylase